MENPFAAPGLWYRAALHAHTTNSDGQMPPESLIRHYRTAGFDVLTITDHWHVTDYAAQSTENFLVLPGIEYNARGPEVGVLRYYHVLGIGVSHAVEEANAPAAFVDAIHAQNGVAIIAHPSWSGLQGTDLLGNNADAVEVWNAGCELEVARGDSSPQWDTALTKGAILGGVATDDSHFPGFDSARAWVALRLASLTRENVLQALRDRCYYSSTGPAIHAVTREGNQVRVECSAARAIHVVGPAPAGAGLVAGPLGLAHRAERKRAETSWVEGMDPADGLTGGTFTLSANSPWFRVVVEDARGQRAWSNPIWQTDDRR
ncbi:MAG TPA: CehA/McbA family metallohydrolase [Chloroflexota bacterium]|nr:CehA/McbA family metallohydrolase [Chloroflexota bacterium]